MIPWNSRTKAVTPIARPAAISAPPTTNHQPLGRVFCGGAGGAGQEVMAPILARTGADRQRRWAVSPSSVMVPSSSRTLVA